MNKSIKENLLKQIQTLEGLHNTKVKNEFINGSLINRILILVESENIGSFAYTGSDIRKSLFPEYLRKKNVYTNDEVKSLRELFEGQLIIIQITKDDLKSDSMDR